MESNFTKEQQYIKAKEKVKEIKGFYIHLVVFLIIMPGLIFFNLNYTPEFHWFWFSLAGWGFGLFSHWLSVIGMNKMGLGKDWEEKKIKEFMNDNSRK